MYAALLKNKWPLLAFVVLMLGGVQYFLGDWEKGALSKVEKSAPAPAAPELVAQEPAPPTEQALNLDGFYDETDVEFVPDEELIDTTEGFDPTPTPDEEFSEGESEPQEEYVEQSTAEEFAEE